MGGAAALISAPVALMVGALLCALINIALLARRSDLRARDLALFGMDSTLIHIGKLNS